LYKDILDYYNSPKPNKSAEMDYSNSPEDKKDLEFPKTNLKIGWCVPIYKDAGTIRIRTLNVSDKLKELGYLSEITNYHDADNFDIVIVGKTYNDAELLFIKKLKEKGKFVVADLSEDILEFPIVQAILAECHTIVCCSEELRKKAMNINKSSILIEDAVEYLIEN
jgi:hypothetical protein